MVTHKEAVMNYVSDVAGAIASRVESITGARPDEIKIPLTGNTYAFTAQDGKERYYRIVEAGHSKEDPSLPPAISILRWKRSTGQFVEVNTFPDHEYLGTLGSGKEYELDLLACFHGVNNDKLGHVRIVGEVEQKRLGMPVEPPKAVGSHTAKLGVDRVLLPKMASVAID